MKNQDLGTVGVEVGKIVRNHRRHHQVRVHRPPGQVQVLVLAQVRDPVLDAKAQKKKMEMES